MEVSDFSFCCPSKRITTRANSWAQESTRGVPWNNQSHWCRKRRDLKRVRGKKSQWKVNGSVKINSLSWQVTPEYLGHTLNWHSSVYWPRPWVLKVTESLGWSLATLLTGKWDHEELPAITGPCFSHLQVRMACTQYWYLEQCLAQSTYSNQC